MEYLFIIALFGFFLWIIRNTLAWVALWQSKEYRLDRLSVHFRETIQGKQLFASPIMISNWVLLFSFGMYPSGFDGIAVALLYVCAGIYVLFEIISGYKLRRPVRTVKAITITLLSVFSVVALSLILGIDSFRRLLFLDNLLILLIAFYVFLFALPTRLYIQYKIKKAKERIKQHEKLLIIGVSGSYGKSSTKEYIAQVLAAKYNVVKTFGSNNTPIGIANTILSRITNKTEIFVVELGAYKRGEIAELCTIVLPRISVTTSVSDQHLSLYGTLQNAIDTERELISALPKDGVALFNGNNANTYMLYKQTKKQKVLYAVIASQAKQSRESFHSPTGLPRDSFLVPRNDEVDIVATSVQQAI